MSNKDNTQGSAGGPEHFELSTDDALYLRWARDIGFDLKILEPNMDTDNEDEFVPSVQRQIDDWFDEFYVPVINELWDLYVPTTGACTVLQGEMSRCVGRLESELFKNGMMNMGDGYYDEMVDRIKDTVLKDGKFSPLIQDTLEKDAMIVKGADYEKIINTCTSFFQKTDVESSLNRMKMVVAAWCKANPEPIEYKPGQHD